MPSTVIRDFRATDAEAINCLAPAAFEEFSSKYSDWPALASILGRMSDLAQSDEMVVAEFGGRIAGAVAYIPPYQPKAPYFEKAWPIIRSLVVDPRCRRAGVGRALTEECVSRARRDRAYAIALHTSPILTVDLQMYLSMGFEFHHEAPPIQGVPYAVYTKRLVP